MNLHQYPTRLKAKSSGMFLMLRRVEFILTELATREEKALSTMVKVVGKILWRCTSFIFFIFCTFLFFGPGKNLKTAEFNGSHNNTDFFSKIDHRFDKIQNGRWRSWLLQSGGWRVVVVQAALFKRKSLKQRTTRS
jgi:hypothetical protein